MDNLIVILEREIVKLNKAVAEQDNFEASRDLLSKLIDGDNIIYISVDDFERLDSKTYNLASNEMNFLSELSKLGKETKDLILSLGLDQKQRELIGAIKEKLNKAINLYDKERKEKYTATKDSYKNLLMKLKNDGLNFITEFDLIRELFDKNNVAINTQIAAFEEINQFNIKINDKLVSNNEDSILEEQMQTTNLDKEKVANIFENYGLDFKKIPLVHMNRLLSYGNYDQIDAILLFLTDKTNHLSKVLEYPEILVKILVYSSVEILEDALKLQKENDLIGLLETYPTILFPSIIEKKKKYASRVTSPSGTAGKTTKVVVTDNASGAYNHFKRNLELLDELNIPASVVMEKCPTFFMNTARAARKTVSYLALYGLNPIDENNLSKTAFSIFRYPDILLDNLDMAIEADCLTYVKNNMSRLIGNENIFNRVKLAHKKHLEEHLGDAFIPYRSLRDSDNLYLRGEFITDIDSMYGNTTEETYKLYEAVSYEDKNSELYDAILDNSDNSVISSICLDDDNIKELDSLFKSSELTYDFNGVIISRKKVLRYYETLISDSNINISKELLLYVITKNSMLDENELKNIKDCVNKLGKGGYVKC